MNERGRLEGVSNTLVPHLALGDAPQLLVDHRDQALERRLVALSPSQEQVGHLRGQRLWHGRDSRPVEPPWPFSVPVPASWLSPELTGPHEGGNDGQAL